MIGQVFSRLTVISSTDKRGKCLCRCICGTEKMIDARSVARGQTRSCGCLRNERVRATLIKHGATGSPEFVAYHAMRKRCLNPHDTEFANYGNRGIYICDRWLNGDGGLSGAECFLLDMGKKPSPSHSLDRRDNDGPYSPDNCHWASKVEQARNRRITAKDGGVTVAELSMKTGLRYETLMDRYRRGDRGERLIRPVVPR